MSAQTIFSALDYLNRWARAKAYRLALKTQLVTSKHRNSPSVSGTCISLAVFEKKKQFSEERDFISFSLGFSLICQENLCSFSTNQTNDLLLISPYIVTLKSNVKVMTRKEMIANFKSSWLSNKFFSSVPRTVWRIWILLLGGGAWLYILILLITKIKISSIDWFKKLVFSTNLLAKLLSNSLL